MKNNKYLPSVDSLRALAVISVIIYHIKPSFLPGGFLGVDLFFVLSGYLIGSLILKEYKENGKINFIKFYVRRARRLLPAVYLMITIILIFMVIFNKYLLEKSYLDSIFGYMYSSNWWYIFHKVDYFDSFTNNSPFKHLWSLAIEEQFYLIFPILFVCIQRFSAKIKNFKILKYSLIFLMLLSLFIHIILFDINNINRVYYGTDTRIFALLIGVIGALYFPIEKLSEKVTTKENKYYTIVSIISIFIFILIMFNVSEYSKFLYYGGFFVLSFLFLVILLSTGHQNTYISKLMSFKPLVYIGKFSYSLYLWHFPIIILTTPSSEYNNPNLFFLFLRILLIFIFSWLSYKFIETPIRYKGFKACIKILITKIRKLSKKLKITTTTVLFAIFVMFTMGIFGKSIPFISTAFVTNNGDIKLANEFISQNNNKINIYQNKQTKDKIYDKMLLIGDSLAVNIAEEISTRYQGIKIDGKISRQGYEAVEIAKEYENYNFENTAVIFLLGTNGILTEEHVENLLKIFDKADTYFVNVKVPRIWENENNKLLESLKSKYTNLTVIDWYSIANNHPEYFGADNVHLKESGILAMVDLIQNNLKYEVKLM